MSDEMAIEQAIEVALTAPETSSEPIEIDIPAAAPVANVANGEGAPTKEELERIVQKADEHLKDGLRSLGLTEAEAEHAKNLQNFNKLHFQASMNIVSSNSLTTNLKLSDERKNIEARLRFVRERIQEYGDFRSQERDDWVREENMLMSHYTEVAECINNSLREWYKGSAMLAAIQMKLRQRTQGGSGGHTQRSNKPAFRPTRMNGERE